MKHSLIREILPPEIASTSTNPNWFVEKSKLRDGTKGFKRKKSELRDGMVNSGKVLIARWNI